MDRRGPQPCTFAPLEVVVLSYRGQRGRTLGQGSTSIRAADDVRGSVLRHRRRCYRPCSCCAAASGGVTPAMLVPPVLVAVGTGPTGAGCSGAGRPTSAPAWGFGGGGCCWTGCTCGAPLGLLSYLGLLSAFLLVALVASSCHCLRSPYSSSCYCPRGSSSSSCHCRRRASSSDRRRSSRSCS